MYTQTAIWADLKHSPLLFVPPLHKLPKNSHFIYPTSDNPGKMVHRTPRLRENYKMDTLLRTKGSILNKHKESHCASENLLLGSGAQLYL